jgi:hypothetical protein
MLCIPGLCYPAEFNSQLLVFETVSLCSLAGLELAMAQPLPPEC